MESKGSFPCSQEPTISVYPAPDAINLLTQIPLFNTYLHFNIIRMFFLNLLYRYRQDLRGI
jgi:hypothetical protein